MWDGPPTSPVDTGGQPLDRSCSRCAYSQGPGQSCLPADGTPGGLLVVADAPNRGAARPFASKSGVYIRQLVAKSWDGPVVFDYAVKCPAKGGTKLRDAMGPISECRPYLAEVIRQCRPSRVLALGPWAAASILGRGLDMESARRAYGWVLGDVPVFVASGPMPALENKFFRRRYEADLHWAMTCPRPQPSHVHGVVHVVEDMDDALDAEAALSLHDELVFDVETAGVPHSPEFTVLCAALTPVDPQEGDSWVWSGDTDTPGRPRRGALADPDALDALRRLLTTKRISGSNIKYDTSAAFEVLGVDVRDVAFDTQLVRKLIDPKAHGRLEYVVELVGMGGSKEEASRLRQEATRAARRKKHRPGEKPHDHWCVQAIRNGGEPNRYNFALLPDDVLWRYNGRDVAGSAAGTILLRERAARDQPHELRVFEELYRPAIKSFERIERVGIQADRQAFEQFAAYLRVGLDELAEKFKAYGPTFNPNSPKQVADLLFNRLKLPKDPRAVSEKTGDPSTGADVLTRLRGMHPVVDDLLEQRRLQKLDSQYATGLLAHVHLGTDRIHPSFRLDGTETGRISSEDPNSQNLPRAETKEGKMCRDCFVARPGYILIELDQSQIELRVAAGMSGDPEMIEIFKSGLDYHLRTAQLIAKLVWGLTEAQVTDWHRSYCKTVNFGLLYGKTDLGLSLQLGCSLDEARRIRQAILGRFKRLAQMIKRFLAHARQHGGIDVPWDDGVYHTRPLFEIAGHDKWKRQNAENCTTNTPIQGEAAWYTLAAIPRIHAWIDESGADAEIVNTVHDSIILEVHPDWATPVLENGKRIMQSFDCYGVPLIADAKAGDRWGSLRKIKHGETYEDAVVRWVAEGLIRIPLQQGAQA